MKEIWKDIPNYEGEYQVSNLGRVKSFRASSKYGSQKEYILNPTTKENGYCNVTLYGKYGRHKFLVHRLVAEAFIPNPNGYPQVNHKDENPLNNAANNLEWCTAEYNNAYGTARVRITEAQSHPVEQLSVDGRVIAIYRSASIACQIIGVKKSSLGYALRKGTNCKGYFWKYSERTL